MWMLGCLLVLGSLILLSLSISVIKQLEVGLYKKHHTSQWLQMDKV